MNKEDILARSRAENQGTDEYETQILEKAGKLSAQVGMLMCCMIAVISVAVTGQINYGCWIIYFAILSTLFWTKWLYMKKRHELILSIFYTAAGLLFAGFYALELAGWRNG